MAKKVKKKGQYSKRKKTSIGNSKFSKTHSKGGGPDGTTRSKLYRKKYRGQGKKR
jgi:hypothetical protein